MKNLIPLLFCSMLFINTSCNLMDTKKKEVLTAEEFNTIEVGGRYKINIPKYMTAAKNLTEDASLQYQNTFKETYTIVIDESKQEFIDAFIEAELYDSALSVFENYRNFQIGMIGENITVNTQSTPVKLTIGSHNASQVEIEGHVENVPTEIAYLFTFIEGKNELFTIMSWTSKSQKEKYFDTFKAVAHSLRTRKVQ